MKTASSVCAASEWHSRGWTGLAGWQEKEGFRRHVLWLYVIILINVYVHGTIIPNETWNTSTLLEAHAYTQSSPEPSYTHCTPDQEVAALISCSIVYILFWNFLHVELPSGFFSLSWFGDSPVLLEYVENFTLYKHTMVHLLIHLRMNVSCS